MVLKGAHSDAGCARLWRPGYLIQVTCSAFGSGTVNGRVTALLGPGLTLTKETLCKCSYI